MILIKDELPRGMKTRKLSMKQFSCAWEGNRRSVRLCFVCRLEKNESESSLPFQFKGLSKYIHTHTRAFYFTKLLMIFSRKMSFDTCSTLGFNFYVSSTLYAYWKKFFSYQKSSPSWKLFYCKMFCVKFLFSSSFAVLKRCGAFLMVFRTLFTLGLIACSDRRPLPPDSAIVGNAELLFRLNEPKRSERDNERDSGRSRCIVEDCDELGEDDEPSVAFLSSSDVTNLSSSAKSALLLDFPFPTPFPEAEAVGRTSESWKRGELEWNSFRPLIIIMK